MLKIFNLSKQHLLRDEIIKINGKNDKMKKNVLILGSGGREYAMVWKLFNDQNVDEIHCIPGNGGTKDFAFNHNLIQVTMIYY